MACRLTEEQISALFGAVHGEVIASKNRDDKFNALQAIRGLYKKLTDAGAEQVNAMDYIQHMPSMLLLSYAMFEDAKSHMRKSGVNLSELDQLDADFTTDIQNVAKFVTPAVGGTAEAAKEIIEETNPSTGVQPTEMYTELEQKDQAKKTEIFNSETSFTAVPDTALAVFNQEAQAYDGITADQNIPDPDPIKRAYYTVVRKLNDLMSQYNRPNADKLTLGNVTGIFFRVVPASAIPMEQLQQADKDYYSKDDAPGTAFAKTAQQKMEQRISGDETYLVFTDKDGNILYFNQDGVPVEKDKGVIAYGKMRRPYTPTRTNEAKGQVAGQRMVGRVQTVGDMVRKGLGTVEELTNERNEQLDILEKSRQYAVNNPNEVLLFSVTPGRNGYIKEDFSKPNPISSIELSAGFKPWVSNQESGTIQKGGVYFNVPGYEFPLLIRRPKFQSIPNLVQNLADMIFDSTLSNRDKIDTLKQFTYSNDTNIFEDENGKLIIKQNGKELEVTAENKESFVNTLNGQTVNINKDLIGTTFNMPINLDGNLTLQLERYNNFISDNFYTFLAKNDEGKIVSLNAYNAIFPTAAAQTKIFGEVKVQSKEQTSNLEQRTPTDNTVDEFKNMLDRTDFTLRKSLLLDSTATKEQIDAAEKWYSNSPLSKIVPFEVMFNVVNSNALAEFTVSGITLFSGSNFTDLYHEGWHTFSQMFLTRDQKKALYNEARKLTGTFKTVSGQTVKFSAATDMQLEEFMAEDFRKYILSNRKNVIGGRPVRNTLFRKIFNFLKQLFSGYSLKDIAADRTAVKGIQELYDKVYVGDINDYTPSIRNVQFGILNKGVEALDPGVDQSLNYQDSMTMVETIDSLMASTISGYGFSVGSIFTNPELMGPLYQQVKLKLEELRKQQPETTSTAPSTKPLANPSEFTDYSGGAKQADSIWDQIGRTFGLNNFVHFYDKSSKNKPVLGNTPLDKAEMEEGIEKVKRTYAQMGRPDSPQYYSLHGRNWFQVKNADAIFAVSDLVAPGEKGRKGYVNKTKQTHVEGGTGYAVQMAINEGKPVYVFHQASVQSQYASGWYKYNPATNDYDSIDTPVLTKKFAGIGTSTDLSAAGKQAIANVYEKTFGPRTVQTKPNNAGRIIDFALANWGDFSKVAKGKESTGVIAFHKKRSSYFTFEDKMAEMDGYDQSVNEEAKDPKDGENPLAKTEQELREDFGANAFERKGNELSTRELASNEIVYLIKSLPQLDKKGNPVLNSLGVPKLVDFNRTWGTVINTVAGSNTTSQMYSKLLDAATRFPELKALVQRLGNPLDYTQTKDWPYMKMWISFFRDFSVYRVPIKEGRIISTNDGFRFEFSEVDPQFRQVEKVFQAQFHSQPAGRYIIKSPTGNQLNTTQIIADFPYSQIFGKEYVIINEDKAIQFLRASGFYLSDNNAIREKIRENFRSVGFLYKAVKDLADKKQSVNNPIDFLRKNESTSVKKILTIEAQDSGKYSNNAVTNVNGDIVYDLSLNNSITRLLNDLNDAAKDYSMMQQGHLQHLDYRRNPLAKYSMWLNSMFSIPSGNMVDMKNINQRKASGNNYASSFVTMDIVNLDGIKSVVEQLVGAQVVENGIKTTNLDGGSKFIFDIHTMLSQGVMELPRHASKSTAYGLSVSKIDSPYNTEKTRHLYISPGHFADPTRGLTYSVELMLPKIAAEMERMAIIKQGLMPNIPGFNERGEEFMMFDDILTEETQDKLKAIANADDSLSLIKEPQIKQAITNDIRNYLNKLVAENMELFQEMPFISEDLLHSSRDGKNIAAYISQDLKITVGQDQKQMLQNVAIKAFTVNALLHNMESVSVLYGDLAIYDHAKEDFHKRNASVGSTGRIFASDEATNQFINNLGRAYARKIGAQERSFDGVLRTAIFKDNDVPSVYYGEYLEALTKKYGADKAKKILAPYESMTEGDGQGWITFDSYRILSVLENAWSEKQNDLYNRIINGEDVNPADITEFFPTKKFQYAGPLKTDKLHVQALHKFSLVPLIPSLIKGTNMETVHDNLVKQGYDYGLFKSGSKLGIITANGKPDSLYENDDYSTRTIKPWNEGDPAYTPNDVFIQYLKDQVDIQSTWKNKTIFSTQLRKLIINDTFRQGLALTDDFNKLVKSFEGILDELQDYKKQELLKQAGWKQDTSGNLSGSVKNLLEFVVREMERLELPEHDIDYVRDDIKNGTFTDLSFSLNAEKIEKMLNNIVVKRLVKQKMTGEQLVAVSGAGFESRSRYTNPSEEEIKKYRGTNDLPTYRPGKGKNGKTTAMKIKIALKGNYYKLLDLKHTDGKKIETRERLNEMIKDENWLNKSDHRKMITMVGVRIPVQGLNSMEFMEVYEFLPEEAGSIIVPPAEIVAKSGSDFDIDKLTIFQPNIGVKVNRDKSKAKLKELSAKYPDLDFSANNVSIILDAAENDFSVYELTEDEKKIYKILSQEASDEVPTYIKGKGLKSTENKVIEKIREILEHPDNFDALIRPNDTDLVKGVADDLAKENIHGFDPLTNKSKAKGKKISPTRVLESRYNLYKHDSNNIGKKTLGIGAVDNAYSSIFKRVGARLEKSYTHYSRQDGQINLEKEPQVRPINIRMKHNTITENGVEYISLSDIDTVTNDKVSDLIGQLMNGWVDIEKDAWIFNINGNNIAGPVLLFLLETGVDFRTAAYFVSQPLVIDYIKERYKVESPFYNAANPNTPVDSAKPLRKFNVKKDFYIKYGLGPLSKKGNLSNELLYKAIESYNNNVTYDVKSLEAVIKSKDKTSKQAKAGLLHFMELEEIGNQLTNIKLSVNVDTAPSKSLYSATERLDKIEGLEYVDAVPKKMIDKILTESPISSFLIQKFQLGILKPLMQLRGDSVINNFLLRKIQAREFTSSFGTPEKFVAAFHNDLPLYMMQNYIKGINFKNLKEYKGLAIQQAIPVQNVTLQQGAFVKDGVMYVDLQQIEDDFNSGAYKGAGYKSQNLATVDPGTFDMGSRYQNMQEYTHFVMEREYLRSITPVKPDQSREKYEQQLATRALERTFNFYHMLKAPGASIADQFLNIKAKYPQLAQEYMIIDALGYVNKGAKFNEAGDVTQSNNKNLRTLKLNIQRLDKDLTNTLHENLVRLADPMTVKVDNPAQNAEISKFFNRMIVAEYIRAGVTKSGDNLAKILPKDTLLKLMAEPLNELSNMKDKSTLLNQYYEQFVNAWNSKNSSSRLKYRNYLTKSDLEGNSSSVVSTPEEIIQGAALSTNKQGMLVYPTVGGFKSAQSLLANHKNIMFVYGDFKDTLSVTKEMDKSDNAVSFPITLDGKKPLTDATFEENAKRINDAITALETQIENGTEIAFPEQGITVVGGKDMLAGAPRTKSYMASELYKRINYLTPGMQYDPGVRSQMQAGQEITDQMVDDFMKKCFGE
jgi:hypothetical protein